MSSSATSSRTCAPPPLRVSWGPSTRRELWRLAAGHGRCLHQPPRELSRPPLQPRLEQLREAAERRPHPRPQQAPPRGRRAPRRRRALVAARRDQRAVDEEKVLQARLRRAGGRRVIAVAWLRGNRRDLSCEALLESVKGLERPGVAVRDVERGAELAEQLAHNGAVVESDLLEKIDRVSVEVARKTHPRFRVHLVGIVFARIVDVRPNFRAIVFRGRRIDDAVWPAPCRRPSTTSRS
jgi:hypothetical protein